MSEDPSSLSRAASAYIPADWRLALARDTSLPEYTEGVALFADISGFTPLTEALARALGLRRGAEELPRHLNRVYDALIAEVHGYGGSVVGFSGDAITCWFAEAEGADAAPLRATAAALAMHRAMDGFAAVQVPGQEPVALLIKVAIASGPARRFLVGDPAIQLIPAMAGETLARMAAAEERARRGQVVVDAPTAAALAGRAYLDEIEVTSEAEDGDRFFRVHGLEGRVSARPWPSLRELDLAEEDARLWVLPSVWDRLQEGLGEFLTELRPAVALFLRFGGIDYEAGERAGARLDAYIRWVQQVVARYEGTLLQLTVGEKGSYLYIAFGAPAAHEDDVCRAVETALSLSAPPTHLADIGPVQMGISRGTMRTGTYGSAARRTYGVLGDQVNLAARLMLLARPGEILASREVQAAVAGEFQWELLPPIQVKGKREPVPLARLLGRNRSGVTAVSFAGDLVGRREDLAQLTRHVRPVLRGRFGGAVYVYGEAGMGKSRLVYALRHGRPALGEVKWLTCPAEAILCQSLNPFKRFLRHYFAQDPAGPEAANLAAFDRVLEALRVRLAGANGPRAGELDRELDRTRSMLGALVDLHWEDSLYERLEPRRRFENTLLAFRTLVRAESLCQPVVVHIEDTHWLDADSQQLLRVLTRKAEGYPFALLLTGRYGDDGDRFAVPLEPDVPQHAVDLGPMPPAEIRAVAAQALGGPLADDLADFLADKTGGNPLFAEQVALDLRQRGLLDQEEGGWAIAGGEPIEVPASINAVLIALLDRLAGRVKAAVQTASVLGTEFEVPVLARMLRDDASLPAWIREAEEEKIWSAVDEMLYLFRYTLLRDAAYDMQVQTRLRALHALAARSIEQVYGDDLGPYYADLAYHYGMAQQPRQEGHYARLAGERAAGQFANQEAIGHYRRALVCAADLDRGDTAEQRQALHLALGQLLITMGQYDEAEGHLHEALALAGQRGDVDALAAACRWMARGYELRGDYPPALAWVGQGLAALAGKETAEATELRLIAGLIHTRQGEYTEALETCHEALRIAAGLEALAPLARAHNLLGTIDLMRGNHAQAVESFAQAFALYECAGHVEGQALAHNQMANAFFSLGRWTEAEDHYQAARKIFYQIGDVYNRAVADNNLGGIMLNQGRLDEALDAYLRVLAAFEEIGGSLWVLGMVHMNLGATFVRRGDAEMARFHLHTSRGYFDQARSRDFLPELHRHLAGAALLSGDLLGAGAHGRQALDLARELTMRGEEGSSLAVLGRVALQQGQLDEAEAQLAAGLAILKEVGEEYEAARCRLSLAEVNVAAGRPEAAREALGRCLPVFERLGARLDLAAAREFEGRTG
ncbi:MAG: tetratricopeptide repeat protein [Anaerolineae bacterium]